MILIIIIDFLQIFDTVSQHHLNICVILIKYTYLISLILSVLCFSKENFTFFFGRDVLDFSCAMSDGDALVHLVY